MDAITSAKCPSFHSATLRGATRIDNDTVAVHCPKNGRYKGQPVTVSDSVVAMCQQADALLKKADRYIKNSANQFSHIYASGGRSWLGGARARELTAKSPLKDPSTVLTRGYKCQGMSCQELSLLMLGLAEQESPGTPKGLASVNLGQAMPVHQMPYLGDPRIDEVVYMDKHALHPLPCPQSASKFQAGVTFRQSLHVTFDPAAALVNDTALNKFAAAKGLPQIDMNDPTNRTLVKAIFLDEAKRLENGKDRMIFEQNFSMDFPDATYVSSSHSTGIAFNQMPVETYYQRQQIQQETADFIAGDPELAQLEFTTDGIDVPNSFSAG